MSSQFSIKDYLNYTISGVLWMILLGYLLLQLGIISENDISNFIQLTNTSLLGFVIVFFGGYTIGNILRFTDCIILWLNNLFFGDPYYYALFSDKKTTDEQIRLGWIGNRCKSKNYRIGKKDSLKINEKLKINELFKMNKKDQYIGIESYLSTRFSNKKSERMNDLKNFYDSISAPVFAIFSILIFETFKSNLSCIFKLLVSTIILMIIYQFIERYRFLFSNFIKETYRSFLFLA